MIKRPGFNACDVWLVIIAVLSVVCLFGFVEKTAWFDTCVWVYVSVAAFFGLCGGGR